MLRLVVRLDPIAALRRLPGGKTPDLHAAAHAALLGGADAVRLTLGEEAEARDLRARLDGALQLDIAAEASAVAAALRIRPERVCLHAKDPLKAPADLAGLMDQLAQAGVPAALRLPPTEQALLAANEAGAVWADLDTTALGAATTEGLRLKEFLLLQRGATSASQLGLRVTVGGGLGAGSLARVALIREVEETHVGFSVLARSLFTGLTQAVRDLRRDLQVAAPEATEEAGD